MLALFKDDTVHGEFREGGWFKLPDGRKASPAQAGWTSEDGYRLETIEEADPVPPAKISNGTTVQVVAGKPKKVHDLVDEPAPSTNPADYPLTKLQFEAALMALGVPLDAIDRAIDQAVTDNWQRAIAKSRVRNSFSYDRNHPLFSMLKGPLAKTDAEIDAAWMIAKDVR